MDLNKFTEKAQEALQEAQNVATRHQHQAVDVEHQHWLYCARSKD